jgi:hypothetical protein
MSRVRYDGVVVRYDNALQPNVLLIPSLSPEGVVCYGQSVTLAGCLMSTSTR